MKFITKSIRRKNGGLSTIFRTALYCVRPVTGGSKSSKMVARTSSRGSVRTSQAKRFRSCSHPTSQFRSGQRRAWLQVQREVERMQDYTCSACGHLQQRQTKHVYLNGDVAFTYTGRDVRAVHVIPPYDAPGLMHHPTNLLLLCWECLLGTREQNLDQSNTSCGWKDESVTEWIASFAHHLRHKTD